MRVIRAIDSDWVVQHRPWWASQRVRMTEGSIADGAGEGVVVKEPLIHPHRFQTDRQTGRQPEGSFICLSFVSHPRRSRRRGDGEGGREGEQRQQQQQQKKKTKIRQNEHRQWDIQTGERNNNDNNKKKLQIKREREREKLGSALPADGWAFLQRALRVSIGQVDFVENLIPCRYFFSLSLFFPLFKSFPCKNRKWGFCAAEDDFKWPAVYRLHPCVQHPVENVWPNRHFNTGFIRLHLFRFEKINRVENVNFGNPF